MRKSFIALLLSVLLSNIALASEVLKDSQSQVAIIEHPKTGKPYVSISSGNIRTTSAMLGAKKLTKRPDYRMLDPKVSPKDVGYDGPYSDRKKVYILAASLATVGTVSGAAVIAAAPAATGAGAASGAGALAGAGAGVAAGTLGGTYALSKSDPNQDDFTHTAQSKTIGENKNVN